MDELIGRGFRLPIRDRNSPQSVVGFGLLLNSLFGWACADPIAALVIAVNSADSRHERDCCDG